VAFLLMDNNIAESISDVIRKGKLELDLLFGKLPTRIIQVGERFGGIHIALISIIFIMLSIINHHGGLLHPDVEINIPHFLSNRPLLEKLYDSRIIESGYFRARELSYLVDYVDYKFFELSVNFGQPHFLSLIHYVFSLIISVVFWQFCVKDLELGKLNATLLILLFWTSTYIFLGGVLFRTAKIGVSLTSVALFVILYRTLKRERQIEGYKLPASIWLICFGLSCIAALFDEQGFFIDFIIIIFLFVWMISFSSRNTILLISAFITSFFFSVIYKYIVAPYLTLYLNHYYPDFSYQQGVLSGDYFVHFSQYFNSGVFLLFETIRYTLGNFPNPVVSYSVILITSFFVFVGIKEMVKNKPKPNPVFSVIVGMALVLFVFIPLMNSLMILRHRILLNYRSTYYSLPVSTLVLMALSLLLSYLKKARIIPTFVIAIFLAIAVIGNLISLPRNTQAVRIQSDEYYKNTPLLLISLRHINDKNYQAPDFIKQNPVYDFFASERH
jgi:hypothetical protein